MGPFPSDALTVADPQQKTGLRLNLPLPDCRVQPPLCLELGLVNQLDGFSIFPRISVRFSGQVKTETLRQAIWIVTLDNLTTEEHGLQETGQFLPLNQIWWDPATNTAYAKPDYILDQHRRYGLLITDAISDSSGIPVEASDSFRRCLAEQSPAEPCASIQRLVAEQEPRFGGRRILAATVFTTMSATAWLENARDRLPATRPEFQREPGKSVFQISQIRNVVVKQQVSTQNGEDLRDFDLTPGLPLLSGVGRIAFGRFRSPNYMIDRLAMAPVPSGLVPPVQQVATMRFHAFVPAAPKPPSGYPVVIAGHAITDSRFGMPSLVAGIMAGAGFVTVAIDAWGHGNGPESRIEITEADGAVTAIASPGRGLDIDDDGRIDDGEGCLVPVIGARDCLRQTTVDLMQLVRAIRAGIDLDGDGSIDLNGDAVYYLGQSLGAIYGTMFTAVDPYVRAAVLNAGGASMIEIARTSPGFRSAAATLLAAHSPGLLNRDRDFDEAFVPQYRPVRVIDVPGAVAVQDHFERVEWLSMVGDPLSFAPHLFSSTLPGIPIKPVLWQVVQGDRQIPLPTGFWLVRAANMRESTRVYRHDRALEVFPQLPENPHGFLVTGFLGPPQFAAVSLAAQAQAAGFLSTDGELIADPNPLLQQVFNGRILFEPAPETLAPEP